MVTLASLRAAAGEVPDPEIPVLTLDDLGIVRDVRVTADGTVEVDLTPTYTGCPATEVIAADVTTALRAAGAPRIVVRTVLSPAWTTEWMTAAGRRKLREWGVAPPGAVSSAPPGAVSSAPPGAVSSAPPGAVSSAPPGAVSSAPPGPVALALSARCPRCGSPDTREISRFGSTPCKALWTCRACLEPFDSFKAL
jgi:ring-1,2-phenylacetyl-CoA epoxidase subunit PaaD